MLGVFFRRRVEAPAFALALALAFAWLAEDVGFWGVRGLAFRVWGGGGGGGSGVDRV